MSTEKINVGFRYVNASVADVAAFSKEFKDPIFDFAIRKNKQGKTVLSLVVDKDTQTRRLKRFLEKRKIIGKNCELFVSVFTDIDNGVVELSRKHVEFISELGGNVFFHYTVST